MKTTVAIILIAAALLVAALLTESAHRESTMRAVLKPTSGAFAR